MSGLTHGHSMGYRTSRTYQAWTSMKTRCTNPKCKNFHHYGGRGITYDPSWASFETFLADMGECPPKMQIDRIDNSKGYSKDNCRWATQMEQANNKRNNRRYEFAGKRLTMSQWSLELGVPRLTLWQRIHRYGYSIEQAFTAPVQWGGRR